MPMQPSPSAETVRPCVPSARVCTPLDPAVPGHGVAAPVRQARGRTVPMADDDIEIPAEGDHEYVVIQRTEVDDVETCFRLTPDVLDRLGTDDEEDVVRRTVLFLRRHQDVADFPDIVELEDVIASYEDYLPAMVED